MKTKHKRGSVKYARMQVIDRIDIDGRFPLSHIMKEDDSSDMVSTNSSAPSPVGSFELRLYRTDPETSEGAETSEAETPVVDCVDRPPAYDKCAEWYDCNSNLDFEGPLPPFQIEFVDHKDAGKAIKDRVLKCLPTYCKLWTTFVFNLRSATDLQNLGFECPINYETQSPPLIVSNTLAESKASKAEGYKQEPEDMSTGNALVKDFVEHTPRENSEGNEDQKIMSSLESVPVLTPRMTSSNLLNVMSKRNREEPLSASEKSEDGSARETMTPTTERADDSRTRDLDSRFYSSQGVGFFNNGAGLERVPVLHRPEPVMSANRSKNDAQPKQGPADECDTPRMSRERGPGFLPGVTGVRISPAHKAFLERRATQETESREATPTPVNGDDFNIGGDFSIDGCQTSPGISAKRRGLSQRPEAVASMEGGKLGFSGSQGELLGSVWKPLTPQVTSLKRQSTALDYIWRPMKVSNSFEKDPLVFIGSQGSLVGADLSLPNTLKATSLQNQAAFRRALSEAPSDSDTEVADPEDIERAVKASQRSTQSTSASRVPTHPPGLSKSPLFADSGHSSRQSPGLNTAFKYDPAEEEDGNHTFPSQVLGAMPSWNTQSNFGKLLPVMGQSDLGSHLGDPAQHSRHEPHNQTPGTPTISPIVGQKATTPAQNATHVQCSPSPSHPLPPRKQATTTATQPKPAEKRKADAITGKLEVFPSPSKTTIKPASRKFENLETERLAAEARIAAAQKKKEELERKLEAAEALAERRKKIQNMNDRAAEVERENSEIEARIASIYGSGGEA
ncbi:hypothetical protein BKA64DRAFT_664126 [Cadophora sp. MPI-SDFR-AT-0126]|nr:hypothetical protein BKA64DRAFT_664126 [Leotiomycetes sp. MPI-SDFR-AT-0126]